MPRETTAFVGRDAELASLEALAGERLIALVGPAGIGKSRLALRSAERQVSRTPVVVVSLEDARGADDLTARVARALDVSAARLERSLASRGALLLVLDAFEHVGEAGEAVIERWISRASELRVLLASRTAPASGRARVVRVEPLREAEALLLSRAQLVRPGYEPTAADAEAIGAICRRVDGHPLAIEVAASWMGLLGPRQILERLGPSIDLCDAAGDRRLGRVLDRAWDALSTDEQRVLAQLSCFRGGFGLAAAEAIVGGPTVAGVAVVVEALRRKSIVRSVEPGLGEGGALRLSLLEPIRDYAASKLRAAAADERAAHERHVRFYARAASRWAEAGLEAPGAALRSEVWLELENVLVASERAMRRGEPTLALELLAGLGPVLPLPGVASTVERGVTAALDRGDAPPLVHARALHARAVACIELGAPARAESDLSEAKDVLARAPHEASATRAIQASIENNIGLALWLQGRATSARERYERALEEPDGIPTAVRGRLFGNLGIVLAQLGELALAAETLDRALACHRAIGNVASEGCALETSGHLALRRGDPDRAAVLLERALACHRAARSTRLEGTTLGFLGLARIEQHRLDDAQQCLEAALALHRSTGNVLYEGLALGMLGDLDRERGDTEAAGSRYAEALELARSAGDSWAEALWLVALASAQAACGRADRAEASLAAAEELLIASHDEALRVVRDLAAEEIALASPRADVAQALESANDRLASLDARIARDARPVLVRLAVRSLERAIERAADRSSVQTVRARANVAQRSDAPSLEVGQGARWFRVEGGQVVSLERRALLRRLLTSLLDEREQRPGHALTVHALCEAGWPGERALPMAAANRLYVAIRTLRRMGLERALLTVGDGYLLNANLTSASSSPSPSWMASAASGRAPDSA